jgi:DNA repair protein RadC
MDFGKREVRNSACVETVFDPVQLDLPGVVCGELACSEWRVPSRVLADLLRAIGVHEPREAASRLMNEFGSLSGLLAASRGRLCSVAGRRLADVIEASRGLMHARLLETVEDAPVVPRSRELIDMLQIDIGFLQHERLLALYVDSRLRLIQIRRIADGSWSEAAVNARRVIQYGLELGASAFILAHNHPSGIPRPSTDDLACTSKLRTLAAELDMHMLDHLIIARGRFGSIEDYWREARWSA